MASSPLPAPSSNSNPKEYTARALPFCQTDNSCCAVSLYACLCVGTNLGKEGFGSSQTAVDLYQHDRIFEESVRYGFLLWKIGVITERTDAIIDALVDIENRGDRSYVIREHMRKGHYMYACMEDVFLKCLQEVVKTGTRAVKIHPAFSDMAFQLPRPINANTSTNTQMVDNLVRHCHLLSGAVVTDSGNVFMEMVFDPVSADVQKKYRLLNSIFADCKKQMRALSKLEGAIYKLYDGRGNPFNFENLVYESKDQHLWGMYMCKIPELIRYDELIRAGTERWEEEMYKPILRAFPEMSCFIDSEEESEKCPSFLAFLDEHVEEMQLSKLRSPTWSQLQPCVQRTLLMIRIHCIKKQLDAKEFRMSERAQVRWGATVDPLYVEELFANADKFLKPPNKVASFVVTSCAMRSLSVHAFCGSGNKQFVIFDSHGDYDGRARAIYAESVDAVTEALRECVGGRRCDVHFIAETAGARDAIRERHCKLSRFLNEFSTDFDMPSAAPEGSQEDEVAFVPLRSGDEEGYADSADDVLGDALIELADFDSADDMADGAEETTFHL